MIYYLFQHVFHEQHYGYENPLFRGACAAMLSMAIVLFACPWVIRRLARMKLGDNPEFFNQSLNEMMADKKNVPTMGGVLIVFAIFVSTVLLADILKNFYVMMAMVCLVWLAVIGGVDDWLKLTIARRQGGRDGLKSYEKLLFQFGLAVLLGFFIYRYGHQNLVTLPMAPEAGVESYRVLVVPFYKTGILLGVFGFMVMAVLVIAGTSNGVNLTDGMDGLAAGTVGIASFSFMIFAYISGTEDVAKKLLIPFVPRSGELTVVAGAMLGACLGFLWHNAHPAKIFMGDTGSLPLGGLLGYIAVVTRQEIMLFVVGGIFVMEIMSVVLQVSSFKLTGKRIWKCTPIHHHFQLKDQPWTETQIVIRFWLIAVILALSALMTIKLR